MRKLLLAVGGALGAASAVLALGIGAGHADPGSDNSTYNVVGEPYAKAVAILRAQGVKATFGGAVGSDVKQAQCIVASEKVMSASGVIQLSLDCTDEAQPEPASSAGTSSGSGTSGASATQTARPTPGAPGVVTVVPVPVG
ncbi:MAG: hypothetical protein WCP30_06355 [Mycobacteriaceae bacterium]